MRPRGLLGNSGVHFIDPDGALGLAEAPLEIANRARGGDQLGAPGLDLDELDPVTSIHVHPGW